ncbi:MAG: hypothetical protein LBS60_02580 [Deltaproteobacteria bacterium]|jgi:alpha-glucosidase|nr:hypothetical protein [Deltaproteobacteria bacterium]
MVKYIAWGRLALFLLVGLIGASPAFGAPEAKPFGAYYLEYEKVKPNIWRFRLSSVSPSDKAKLLKPVSSIMLTPPSQWTSYGQVSDSQVEFEDNPGNPVVTVFKAGQRVFSFSPYNPDNLLSGLVIHGSRYTHAMGLGADFSLMGASPSLIGQVVLVGGPSGNKVINPADGRTAGLQAPILFAMGQGDECAALFVNETKPLIWDLTPTPWTVGLAGPMDPNGSLEFFVLLGDSLASVRKTYLSIVGRPPLPPKTIFSPYVVDRTFLTNQSWETYFQNLREETLPFGITGVLIRDLDGDEAIVSAAKKSGFDFMAVETPYVKKNGLAYEDLAQQNYLVRVGFFQGPILNLKHRGDESGLVDFTSTAASNYYHNTYRNPVLESGVTSFFLLGGEPESYSAQAFYRGELGRGTDHSHYAWANRFSFRWMEGFISGAQAVRSLKPPAPEPRLFMLTRSGLGGQGRLGAGFYYLDPNIPFPISEGVARANLSLSGIDYFTPDAFPMLSSFDLAQFNPNYASWLARNSLISYPLLVPRAFLKEPWLNFNLRIRAKFFPYVYSLAYEAYVKGDPIVAPLFYHFPQETLVRERATVAMIGPHILLAAGLVMSEENVNFTLPAGQWYDFYRRNVIFQEETGEIKLHCKMAGISVAPILLRAGAVVPTTPDAPELKDYIQVLAFPGSEVSYFDLYDDNGVDNNYRRQDKDNKPEKAIIRLILTPPSPSAPGGPTRLTINAQEGDIPGRNREKGFIVEFVGVSNYGTAALDGVDYKRVNRERDLVEQPSGWYSLGSGRLVFKTPVLDLNQPHELLIR